MRTEQRREKVYSRQTRNSANRVDQAQDNLRDKQQQRTDVLARQSTTDWSQLDNRQERRNVKKSYYRERLDTKKQVKVANREYKKAITHNKKDKWRERLDTRHQVKHSYYDRGRYYGGHAKKHYGGHGKDHYYPRHGGHYRHSGYRYRHYDHDNFYGYVSLGFGYPYYYNAWPCTSTSYVSVQTPVVVTGSNDYGYVYDDDVYVDSVGVGYDSYDDDVYVSANANVIVDDHAAVVVTPDNHIAISGAAPAGHYWFWNLWASPYQYHRYNYRWHRFKTWCHQEYWPSTFWGRIGLHFNF